ncbi:ABC transporter substrate-binding protein [Spirochaetia bacterium]|nr:ABC transporter substrate-binding protein [Spirochaetia bacterium]
MKKGVIALLLLAMILLPVMAGGSKNTSSGKSADVFPAGNLTIWGTGQPQFRKIYYDEYLERNRDIVPGVNILIEQIKTMADGQQKIKMFALSGDKASMPEVIMLDTVGIIELASAGLLVDQTDYFTPLANEFIDGAVSDATIKGRIYGIPDSVRPQVLFYNAEIFKKYNVDPAMMATFDGYLEAGRLLKQRSNGQVFLSYVDPGSYTWRYWGRRGLMPQAQARIWDNQGNVIIGSDPGAKLALGFFDKLYSEGLLYKTTMMQPPIYEATDEGKIATFYIGAFWDEFLRKNLTATAGKWQVMNAPTFAGIGKRGAPVSISYCIIDKSPNKYTKLVQNIWYDFETNIKARNGWVDEMEKINGPYNNPVSKVLLADPFWQAASTFYGGQSFRKAEGDGLNNPSVNMPVTASDAEADAVISAEIEKYVAGEQTMDQAIANMDRELKLRIKKAVMP